MKINIVRHVARLFLLALVNSLFALLAPPTPVRTSAP